MAKHLVIINGKGTSGKDTMCKYAATEWPTLNVSSADPVKEMARHGGWTGGKTDRDRKYLSRLKDAMEEYDNGPTKYLESRLDGFLSPDNPDVLMFAHIREPRNVDGFLAIANRHADESGGNLKVHTLLVTNGIAKKKTFGNPADDNVMDYGYDLHYVNDKPLEESGKRFVEFLRNSLGLP